MIAWTSLGKTSPQKYIQLLDLQSLWVLIFNSINFCSFRDFLRLTEALGGTQRLSAALESPRVCRVSESFEGSLRLWKALRGALGSPRFPSKSVSLESPKSISVSWVTPCLLCISVSFRCSESLEGYPRLYQALRSSLGSPKFPSQLVSLKYLRISLRLSEALLGSQRLSEAI